MKTSNINKVVSLVGFTMGFVLSMSCGAEYYQGMISGSMFGIWMILVASE